MKRIGIRRTDNQALDTRVNDRIRAGAGASLCRARLERHIENRVFRNSSFEIAKAFDLGMRRTRFSVMPARQDFSTVHENGSHGRIWTR